MKPGINMENEDQGIIDAADRWKKQDYDLKMKKIQLSDSRRKKIIDGMLGVPGFLILSAIFIFSTIAVTSMASWSKEVVDCSKTDKEQLERMHGLCEKQLEEESCYRRVIDTMCEVRYVYPTEE